MIAIIGSPNIGISLTFDKQTIAWNFMWPIWERKWYFLVQTQKKHPGRLTPGTWDFLNNPGFWNIINQGPSFFQVDSFIFYPGCVWSSTLDEVRNQGYLPLLGTNISHQWDRSFLIFPTAFRMGYVTSKNNPVASYAKHTTSHVGKAIELGCIRVSR